MTTTTLPVNNAYGPTCTIDAAGAGTCTVSNPSYSNPIEIISPITAPASAITFVQPQVVRLNLSNPISLPAQNVDVGYQRKDCRTDAAGVQVCLTHVITESSVGTAVTAPSPNPNCTTDPQSNLSTDCNGVWKTNFTTSCTFDGAASATCPPAFDPPPLEPCNIGSPVSSTIVSGTSGIAPVLGTQPPTAAECPFGNGTRIDDMSTPTTYACTDGLATITGTGATTETGFIGACAPPPGCTQNGINYNSGQSWMLNIASTQAPTAAECLSGAGTRIDDMATPTTYISARLA